MRWNTRVFYVSLSDGSRKSAYAETQGQAEERIGRWLVRNDMPQTVLPVPHCAHPEGCDEIGGICTYDDCPFVRVT